MLYSQDRTMISKSVVADSKFSVFFVDFYSCDCDSKQTKIPNSVISQMGTYLQIGNQVQHGGFSSWVSCI